MPNTTTIVYKGERPNYNLHSPEVRCFPRGIPITVNSVLTQFLPEDEFETFNPKIHPKPKNVAPILIRLPKNLTDGLASIRSLVKIREFYPYNPIEALCIGNWDFIIPKIEDFKVIRAFNVIPGQYFQEYNCHVPDNSAVFGGGATFVKTLEFCYLQHLRLMYGDDSKKPTLIKSRARKEYLTIINHGAKHGRCWKEIGDYLVKQKWPWPVKIIDKNEDLKQSYNTISKSKYIISTGDSDLVMLGAYLGIPIFTFIPDRKAVFPHQLDFFNQVKKYSFIHSEYVYHKDYSSIYEQLFDIIPRILEGKDIEAPPERERVTIEEPTRLGRTG